MNCPESKYFSTAERMDQALIALLEKKDLAYITVKEICAAAGVNRSTFYLHYETIDDLLAETMDYINQRFRAYFAPDAEAFLDNVGGCLAERLILISPEYLDPYLQYIRENKSIYRASFLRPEGMRAQNRADALSENILKPILRKFQVPDGEQKYWIAFFIHGISAIILLWVGNDCQEPIPWIRDTIIHCVRPHLTEGQDFS